MTHLTGIDEHSAKPFVSSDGVVGEQLLTDLFEMVRAGSLEDEDVIGFDVISTERELAYYVRKGLFEQLQQVQIPTISFIDSGKNWTRYAKDELISLNAVCLHAAIDGGVSIRVAYGLGNSLLKRIESLTSKSDILEMMESRIVPLGYCLLVNELSLPSVTDNDIISAIRYIHEHHNEKILVSQVAEHVGLSPEHLSAKFKKQTGQTVNGYIVDRRIEEGKSLLRFSSYSISEIAGMLSFSSQSYFQTVFKKKTGMTPQQYRRSLVRRSQETDMAKADKTTE